MRTQAVEDYVKAIWLIQESGERATGQRIAQRLSVSQASVSAMLQRLGGLGLISYEKYQPVKLTASGTNVALEVVRHHRLLELFLAEALGMPWDRIHAEAEVLEHHISEELEDLIAERLGNPQYDPHGHPIPARDGTLPSMEHRPVAAMEVGETGRLVQVCDERPELLRYLDELGLLLGTDLEVLGREPFDGPVTLGLPGGEQRVIGAELSRVLRLSSTSTIPNPVRA
ncbi:MAG: iron (metal) dependent repressor, DtxR family [Thermoleophilia bacterium]|nr:iron (metal) dependent repressor, DtxR family [Thermoleophilia bacterium]